MIFSKVEVFIVILGLACVNGNNNEDIVNRALDSEQIHEVIDLEAEIDQHTGVRRYDNYQLLRINPSTEEHVSILQFLDKGMVDIWNPISPNVSLIDHADLMVAPKHAGHVKEYLRCSGMEVQVISDNLQRQIDTENIVEDEEISLPTRNRPVNIRERLSPPWATKYFHLYPRHSKRLSHPFIHYIHKRSPGTFGDLLRSVMPFNRPSSIRQGRHLRQNSFSSGNLPASSAQGAVPLSAGNCLNEAGFNFKNYHRVSTMHKYLECLGRQYPDKVEVFDIGRSTERRALKVIKIGTPAADGRVKPAVWIDGGIHAREWVSPATVLYFINQLVENSGSAQNRFVVEQLDLYILPSSNPDGYEYSHRRDRMWRKTRSNTGSSCIGVDPNRNWGYKWGGKGASNNPCTETYRGKNAFSEPETRAIKDFILKKMKVQEIKMYLTVHSYGQYFLYPWGYEKLDTHDRRDLHNMGQIGAQAIQRVNGRRRYKVGSAAKMLYPASGGSDDWAKGGAGIKYSYTVELPDTGSYGFLLPSRQIEDVGRETTAGFIAMFRKLITNKTG